MNSAMKQSPRLFAVCALFCATLSPLVAGKATAQNAATSRLTTRDGDILLEGTIEGIALERNELMMRATKFALPNGKFNVISKPSYKVVHFTVRPSDKWTTPQSLALHRLLKVVGPDAGIGSVLEARQIELGAFAPQTPVRPTISTAPAQAAAPVKAPIKSYFNGVRPDVAETGLRIGTRFGVRDIHGRELRSGNSTSDHPRGLALDFIVGHDAQKGNALAAYFEANGARENVKYIIWKDTLIYPGGHTDWARLPVDYGPGMTERHMDHVHISFLDAPRALGN